MSTCMVKRYARMVFLEKRIIREPAVDVSEAETVFGARYSMGAISSSCRKGFKEHRVETVR